MAIEPQKALWLDCGPNHSNDFLFVTLAEGEGEGSVLRCDG